MGRTAEEKKEITIEELWDKLHEERKAWMDRMKRKDEETQAEVKGVRQACDLAIAKMVITFGKKQDDEYVLDIPRSQSLREPGKMWIARPELLDEDTWRIHCKQIDVTK